MLNLDCYIIEKLLFEIGFKDEVKQIYCLFISTMLREISLY